MRDLIDTLRHYAPRTAWTLVGATEAELSALEAVLGRPLPASYREFLLAGGRYLGLFRPFDERYDFSIDTVRAAAVDAPSPRYLFIAGDRSGMDMDLYLDCEPPQDDPSVIAKLRGGSRTDRKDDSFRRFMLTEVFVSMRLPLLVWQATFIAREPNPSPLAALDALARELRIPPVPYTGAWHPCYDRGDIAIEAKQPPGLAFVLTAAAAEESWLDDLQDLLEQRLGLKCLP